jgi:hypothetical protein
MKCFFLIFLLLIQINLNAQLITIRGYIVDSVSGEAVIGANIMNIQLSKGTSSNLFGYFSMRVNANEVNSVRISYIGYKTLETNLQFQMDTLITFYMEPLAETLKEFDVIAHKKIEERVEVGKMTFPVSTIINLPSITGEPDIMKAFQLMPGVQMGAENTNGLFVRGGAADQNLFLLDDVPLYNVNHLGGFFSVFDPSMLKSVDLFKGGFPARYGGRVSSVMDIRTKDGNLNKKAGEIALGLISAKLFLEGPIKSGKSSYALSYRYCNFGIYSYLMNKMQGVNYTQGYHFFDFNLKANFFLTATDRLFVGVYSGDDNVYYREKDTKIERTNLVYSGKSEIKWGNTAASMRWLHIFEGGVFNNTTLYFSKYNYRNYAETKTTDQKSKLSLIDFYQAKSGVTDLGFKNDAEVPLNNSMLRFGTALTGHHFIPGEINYSNSLSESGNSSSILTMNAFSFAGYAEIEFSLLKNLKINSGLRAGLYSVEKSIFPLLEPRLIANYLILPTLAIKSSYNRMQQHIHLLSNSNGGLPTDIWIPSVGNVKPMQANQISFGIAHTTPANYEFSIEIYAKKMSNLIDYQEGLLAYKNIQNMDKAIETGGKGNARGIEFLLQKKSGNLTGWIAYTFSSNTRQFENINQGKPYPYMYDQPHNISITGNYKITNSITLSAVWLYHTGNRITLPTAKYQIIDYQTADKQYYSEVEIYSSKNGFQLPDYHRLDLSANFTRKFSKGERKWSVNVYNAYNRQNAYYLFYKKDGDGTTMLYQRSFFPILLNASYGYRW